MDRSCDYFVSAAVHSPVKGKVIAIEPAPHPDGVDEVAIIIEPDKNQPEPQYARVCDAAVNIIAELYKHNPFQYDLDEFKIYSDDEIEQAKSFLGSLKSE